MPYHLFFTLVNSLTLFFVAINLLPIRLKIFNYFILFFYSYITLLLFSKSGQISSYIILGGFLLLLSFLSRCKLLNLCCAILGYLCSVCLNYFILMLLEQFFHLSIADINQKHLLFFSLIFFIIAYIVTFLFGHLLRKKIRIQDMYIPSKVLIAILSHLLLCTVFFIFNFIYGEQIGYPTKIVSINGFLFCMFFLITTVLLFFIIQILEKEHQSQKSLIQYESLLNYTKNTEAFYVDIHKFKHDYNNILLTLYAYIDENNMSKLNTYFKKEILPTNQIFYDTYYDIGKLAYIEITGVKGLLYTKIVSALEQGIHVEVTIQTPITHLAIEVIDFTRIIGIFLDNAIEGAKTSAAKQMEISIGKNSSNSFWMITNSCDEESLLFSKINIRGYSTKGKNRGFGLYSATELLKKYPKVTLNTYLRNHFFTQHLDNL